MNYKYRYIARIILEAKTPLRIGSGQTSISTDSLVLRDVNGLPYIPGTSIVGVLRHSVEDNDLTEEDKKKINTLFGYQSGKSGQGSTLICSSAHIVGADGRSVEGLVNIDWNDAFYSHFQTFPIRQHVRINDKGSAVNAGKFDEEVVYKGTGFCFEIEVLSDQRDDYFEKTLLPKMRNADFRLGSGTRKGYGELAILSVEQRYYDLNNSNDLEAYLNKSVSLNEKFEGAESLKISDINPNYDGWVSYKLSLRPNDFFLFGSGFGDDDADMTPVKESVVKYDASSKPKVETIDVLIPASSVKGALSHRTAFYYNKLNGRYADPENQPKVEKEAVDVLFGSNEGKSRGNVIFSDVYVDKAPSKIFNHVAIDRFTGGTIDGALYSEKVTYAKYSQLALNIYVNSSALTDDNIRKAFESALKDLTDGYLPLGGGTNRGHGLFTGKCLKDGKYEL